MKKHLDFERRMYCGHPIFVVLYYDFDNKRHNYTTLSSIYSLGKMVVIGCGDNNFFNCVKHKEKFTINFLSEEHLKNIEIGAINGMEHDKLSKSKLDLERTIVDGVEIYSIKQADLVYSCSLEELCKSSKFVEYNNLICNLEHVLIDIDFDIDAYEPLIFIGTDEGKFFRKATKIDKS